MTDTTKPETTLVAFQLNDRHGRRVVFMLNNDQKCVVGSWVEQDITVKFDVVMDGVELFRRLTQ